VVGVVKRLWSMDILISRISRIRRNTERIFQTLADGGSKAAADQPFQAWRVVSWLGSGRRSLPPSPNNLLDSPRYPSVVPLVNIAHKISMRIVKVSKVEIDL
jgi:hypothetical protein